MKYTTFKTIRFLTVIGVVIGIITTIVILFPTTKEELVNSSYKTTKQEYPNNKEIDNAIGVLSETDRTIIDLQKSQVVKNIDKTGKNYKLYKKFTYYIVDMRCDFTKGFSYWNRIKVDLDKDKNYDEKWIINEKGVIRKQVSTNDDGNYDTEYELVNDNWIKH